MEINPNIFKAYDIRGVYPSELNEETAYLIGRAFAAFIQKPKAKVAVGRDNRLSSPGLHKNLIRGLYDSGIHVVDIGLVPTPVLYFSVANYGFDGGINVTASHNPKDYNGFKLVEEKARPIGENTGLKQIKILTESAIGGKEMGEVEEKKVLEDYIDFNFQEVDLNKLKPLNIVADTGNAVPGIMIPLMREKLPGEIHHLFPELDGSFPNHPPNPLIKENVSSLLAEVKKGKADFGVAFDGDGDRIMFVDENGAIIPSDITLALMAEIILKENPGAKIIYDVRSSRAVEEVVKENGGVPIMWKVGQSFAKEKMAAENIIFGGEFSGHFFYQKHYFSEAPIFLLLKIIEKISSEGKTLSQLVKPYQRYSHSGEINFEVKDKLAKIKELKAVFNGGKVVEIDGLRVDFEDWWFNVRPSNTEPLLRLVLEAETHELMEQKKKYLTVLIKRP